MQKPTYDGAAYASDMDIDPKSFLKGLIQSRQSDPTELSYKPDITEIFTALDKEDKITLFTRLVDGNELSGIVDDLNCSKSTAYNYVRDLRSADLVKKKSQGTGFETTRRGNLVVEFLTQLDSDLSSLELEKSLMNIQEGAEDDSFKMTMDIEWSDDSLMNELQDFAEENEVEFHKGTRPEDIDDNKKESKPDSDKVDPRDLENLT